MTKEEFIELYFRGSSEEAKQKFLEACDAQECQCGDAICEGWIMTPKKETDETQYFI